MTYYLENEQVDKFLNIECLIDSNGGYSEKCFARLYNTYAEIDIHELLNVKKAVNLAKDIDLQTILSVYNGHTIFSIFFDQIKVYERIQD